MRRRSGRTWVRTFFLFPGLRPVETSEDAENSGSWLRSPFPAGHGRLGASFAHTRGSEGSMAQLIPSLSAHLHLKAKMTADSWQVGWRSLLLRAYIDPPEVEELKNPPTADHLIVLVTSGSTDIASYHKGSWYAAHYKPGSLAMNASGQENTLRWRGKKTHSTPQTAHPDADHRSQGARTFGQRRRLSKTSEWVAG